MGIPGVAVATEAFAEMGQATARGVGMAGLPLVAVAHGFESLGRSEIREAALRLYPEIVRTLTASPAELEPEYASRAWLPSEDAIAISCSMSKEHGFT